MWSNIGNSKMELINLRQFNNVKFNYVFIIDLNNELKYNYYKFGYHKSEYQILIIKY